MRISDWSSDVCSSDLLALANDVQGIKLIIIVLVEPGADNIEQLDPGAPRDGEGIDHELGDGLLLVGAGLVVEDMDLDVADLKHVDIAGECGRAIDRHDELGNSTEERGVRKVCIGTGKSRGG